MKNTEPLKELKDELVTNSYIADHHENNEIVLRASRAFEISADIIEKTVRQAIINERQRIIELITKYDLIPPQVKMESPRYWKGYEDTVNIILEKLTK